MFRSMTNLIAFFSISLTASTLLAGHGSGHSGGSSNSGSSSHYSSMSSSSSMKFNSLHTTKLNTTITTVNPVSIGGSGSGTTHKKPIISGGGQVQGINTIGASGKQGNGTIIVSDPGPKKHPNHDCHPHCWDHYCFPYYYGCYDYCYPRYCYSNCYSPCYSTYTCDTSYSSTPAVTCGSDLHTKVAVGSVIVINGQSFGDKGVARLRVGSVAMPVEVVEWAPTGVKVRVPQLEVGSGTTADIEVVRADGSLAGSSSIELAPAT
jgi:hypothetical protein